MSLVASKIPAVVYGHLALLVADTTLTTALGGSHVYERMTIDAVEQVPGVYWYLLPATVEETVERAVVRYDIWARGTKAVWAIEARLRALLHFELPTTINSVVTWSTFRQSIDMGYDEGDIARRVVEFEIQPVRLRRT